MTDEMKAKREKLFSSPKNGYDLVDQAALEAMEAYCETYKQYLDNGKTERECAAYTVELAQAQGYVPYQRGMSLKPGDKVYRVNRGKSVMLAKIGRQDLSHGAQIVACHIDSPRRHPQVSVGGHPPGAAGRGGPAGRHRGEGGPGPGQRAQVRHHRSAAPPGRRAGQKAP